MAEAPSPYPSKPNQSDQSDLPGQPGQPSQPGYTGPPPAYHPPMYQQSQGQPMYHQPVMQQPAHMTTVIMTGGMQQEPRQPRDWSTGLCGCMEDPTSCLCVLFCPEFYGCHLASKAGENCCLPYCVPAWLIALRAHIRGKYAIEGSICDDCLVSTYCQPCVMCQLARELDNIKNGQAPS